MLPRRLQAAAGGDALMAVGDFCERTSSDTALCNGTLSYLGLHGGLRARLWESWSFGFAGAYSWAGWSDGIDTSGRDATVEYRLWSIGVHGRWHVRGNQRTDPFLELGTGFARSWSVAKTDSGTDASPGVLTPTLGTALGVDFAIGRYFSLGPELRALFLPFDRADLGRQRQSGSPLYGPVIVYSLGLTLAASYPLES